MLAGGGFDEIVISSGVAARVPAIPGIDHPKVISYPELLSGAREAGESGGHHRRGRHRLRRGDLSHASRRTTTTSRSGASTAR